MATLRTALDGSVSGQGGVVIVSGEAGIGKTRLAEMVAEEARSRGIRVAWGRCWEAGGAPAYWPWIVILRGLIRGLDPRGVEQVFASTGPEVARIVPELRATYGDSEGAAAAMEESEAVRFQLFDAIARSLRALADEGPLLLILDDLHAADEPSILLLRFVAGQTMDVPIMLLATYREGELPSSDPRLGNLVDLGRQPGSVHVSPRALSEDAVRRYLEVVLARTLPVGLADSVHRQTEGNPLFMSEVVRLLVDEHRVERMNPDGAHRLEIPEGVRAVIGRRMTQLSAASRSLLDRASVIGVEIPLEELTGSRSTPAGEVIERLDEAASADILIAPRRGGGAWRFKHALIREVIYSALPAAERSRRHLDVARTLESLHAEDGDLPLAALAHHFTEAIPAADPSQAIEYSRRAAEQASDQAGHEEAMRLYHRALALADSRDKVRVELLIGLGAAATRAGDVVASRDANLEAAELAERLGLYQELARAAVGYGGRYAWVRAGTDRVLVPLLERALSALDDTDSRLRVRLLARLAGALRSDPSMRRRHSLSEQALAMARRLDDPIALAFALSGRYWSIAGPDAVAEQIALADELTTMTAMTRDPERISEAHLTRYDLIVTTGGDHAASRAEVDAFGGLGQALRQPALIWYHSVLRTILAINEGRIDAAEALIDQAHGLGERTLERDAAVSRMLATFAVRREQDRLAEIAEQVRSASDEFTDYPLFRCIATFVDAQTGEAETARRLLDRIAEDEYRSLPRDMGWLFGMSCLAEAAVTLSDRVRALDIERLLRPYASLFAIATDEINAGPVSRVLGLIAAMDGRLEESLGLLRAAERACATTGLRTFEARTMVEIASVLRLRGLPGDLEEARTIASVAMRRAGALGLVAVEATARTLVRDEGDDGIAGHRGESSVTLLRREGDAWEVGKGRTFRVRHAKGLTYLGILLTTPGREHHVLDLVSSATIDRKGDRPTVVAEGAIGDLRLASDAIPAGGLDEEARSAYRARLRDLAAEIDAAERAADAARSERAKWEVEALTRELGAAYGLGGRARPERSAAERARQSVTKAIREAIARIEHHDHELGAHLDRAVRTGIYCAYDPDPSAQRTWRLS